ncbi:MAG: ribosome small subunit-dependent GTPase A [Desulfobulbaceae bacterium]|nr:ribosome small subunit-dependent GTPase A [Desulfobulbaceae bacterium]
MVRVKRNSGHVVGDNVEVEDEVLNRLERQSELCRMDARGGIHIVGANLDVLCIVVTCEPMSSPGFIDRAIVASRAANLTPVLVMNKSDLDCFKSYYKSVQPIFKDSVELFSVSAETGINLHALEDFFSEGHRGIFVGSTGVGKSSILNKMLPNINLSTGEISETKKRGRHTTTVSTLHMLPRGGELVDSPGFNDFGLVDTTIAELATFFPGFEKAVELPCKFRDCKHREEPDCSVTELVEEGEISRERYQTYLQILTEVEMIEAEPKFRERRHRRKKN